MQLPSVLRNIISTLVGNRAKGKLESVSDIRSFKENAWKSKKAANIYQEAVENRFFNRVTARIFLEGIEPNSYVLDVGAGTGRLSLFLADNDFEVLACDISKEMLAHINQHQKKRKVETLVCNASCIPIGDERFDAIVSMDLMLHFPDWENLLTEQARLCKRGGVIMFNFISRDNIATMKKDGTGTVREFYYVSDFAPCASEEEIEEVARKMGLKVEAIVPYNYFTGNALFCRSLSKEQVDAFTTDFNEQLMDDKVMKFVETFEESIVRSLPKSSCVTMMVKLRKE